MGSYNALMEADEYQAYSDGYQQGRKDERKEIYQWLYNHDYTLAMRVLNQYLEEKEQKNGWINW